MADTPRLLEFDDVTVRSISVSQMDNNVYLITDKATGSQVLIDAADDAAAITRLLAQGAGDTDAQPRLELIFTTHRHWDHVRALAEVRQSTGAPTACGVQDAEAIDVPMDFTVGHDEGLDLGGVHLRTVHLRGHTPGSIALVLTPRNGPVQLFTGDSLFPGGVGKTAGPEEFTSLIGDVQERLFERYGDDAVVHPGHGKPTTLGAERASLPQWRERGW